MTIEKSRARTEMEVSMVLSIQAFIPEPVFISPVSLASHNPDCQHLQSGPPSLVRSHNTPLTYQLPVNLTQSAPVCLSFQLHLMLIPALASCASSRKISLSNDLCLKILPQTSQSQFSICWTFTVLSTGLSYMILDPAIHGLSVLILMQESC